MAEAEWAAFADGLQAQDYPPACMSARLVALGEGTHAALAAAVAPRLRAHGYSQVDVLDMQVRADSLLPTAPQVLEPYLRPRTLEAIAGDVERAAREQAVEAAMTGDYDVLVTLDPCVMLTNNSTLRWLAFVHAPGVVAPMMVRPKSQWTNFWAAVSDRGFYRHHDDFDDIVARRIVVPEKENAVYPWHALINVPYVRNVYAVPRDLIPAMRGAYTFTDGRTGGPHASTDPDVTFAANMRDKRIFMYVLNTQMWGHLR